MEGIKIIDIPGAKDARGMLSVVEHGKEIPFEINRVYWIYDVPDGRQRASHAHKSLPEFLVAIAGSFQVDLDDSVEKETIFLDTKEKGVLIPPGIWINITDFSEDAVCLVLAPGEYDLDEYIFNYNQFQNWKNKGI